MKKEEKERLKQHKEKSVYDIVTNDIMIIVLILYIIN